MELNREVNRETRRLKREYFKGKLEDTKGDLRATWEVLGEALRGRRSARGSEPCKYFDKGGTGVTDGKEIADGFCEFYCGVGPELAGKIRPVKDRDF